MSKLEGFCQDLAGNYELYKNSNVCLAHNDLMTQLQFRSYNRKHFPFTDALVLGPAIASSFLGGILVSFVAVFLCKRYVSVNMYRIIQNRPQTR